MSNDRIINNTVYIGDSVAALTSNSQHNLSIAGDTIQIYTKRTISSSNSPGATGEISYDDNYIYVCVGPYNWKRVRLSAF